MDATALRKMLDKRGHVQMLKHLDKEDEKAAQTKKIRKMLDERSYAQIIDGTPPSVAEALLQPNTLYPW